MSFKLKVHFDTTNIKTLFCLKPFYLQMKSLSDATIKLDSSNSTNNTFTFEGTLSHPTLFRLYADDDSSNFSKLIFIDSGSQEMYVNHEKEMYILSSTSGIEKEHKGFLISVGVKTLDDRIDDEKLLQYVEKNPESYIGLYALFNQAPRYAVYYANYNKILDLFSEEIKNTQSYKFFKNWYSPNLKIENYQVFNNENKNVSLNFLNKKYTLLEFWFKGCTGCVEEFNLMKDLYTKDLSARLNIIAISIDNKQRYKESLEYWKNSHYPWPNYWDWDGVNIEKYSTLLYFPTNLLIDSSGIIIGKDIDFETIDQFFK